MDFASWSPSHTILVLVVSIGFIGQVAVFFYRTAQNDKRIDEVKAAMNQGFSDIRSEMNHRFSEVNHRFSDVQSEIRDVRKEVSDVRKEISDVRAELSKLNQNHIDHLTHHN